MVVLLEDLPFEVLERIVAQLPLEDICASVRFTCGLLNDVSRNVVLSKLKNIERLIGAELVQAQEELEEIQCIPNLDRLESELILVAKYTFLQILHSEYRLLSAIFVGKKYSLIQDLIFQSKNSIIEFERLLLCFAEDQWNWKSGHVSTAMDQLRSLNSKIIDLYFLRYWDFKDDHFGSIVLKLLDVSICANFDIEVTHDPILRSPESRCYISGHFEIPDLSNTLVSPPSGLQNPNSPGARILAMYLYEAIRWGNTFHTLKLRWVCMDRALALGRRQRPGWPLVDLGNPYINKVTSISSETPLEESNGQRKLKRAIKRKGELPDGSTSSWFGIKCDFQMWSSIGQAPADILGLKLDLSNTIQCDEEPSTSDKSFNFKMELRTQVRSLSRDSTENTIWVRETDSALKITQSTYRGS